MYRSHPLDLFARLNLWFCAATVLCGLSLPAQASTKVPVYQPDGLTVQMVSDGRHTYINALANNSGSQDKVLTFPYGTVFNTADSRYQRLAVVFTDEVKVRSGGNVVFSTKTACMDAGKSVAPIGFNDWTPAFDQGLADVLNFYDASRPMIEQMTGPEHHDTQEKRHRFLQMVVWIYFGNDKAHMKKFAGKYIFDGDQRAADEFIDTVYPMASAAIDMYKKVRNGGGVFNLPFP